MNLNANYDLQTVKKMYEAAPQDLAAKIYYGGYEKANIILRRIAGILYGPMKSYGEARLRLCQELLAQIWVRKHLENGTGTASNEELKARMAEKYRDIPAHSVADAVEACIGFVYGNEPQLRERDETADFFGQMTQEQAQRNMTTEHRIMADPEVGLVAQKPVFVEGFAAAKAYLGHLRTPDGQPLKYERLGNIEVAGIWGPVDIYQVYHADDSKLMKIYLCVYGTGKPAAAPRGLRYV